MIVELWIEFNSLVKSRVKLLKARMRATIYITRREATATSDGPQQNQRLFTVKKSVLLCKSSRHKNTTNQIIPNGVVVSLFASLIGTIKSFNPVCAIKLGYFVEWSLRVMIGEHWHQLTIIGLKGSSGYLL